jgi:hypothetical protein
MEERMNILKKAAFGAAAVAGTIVLAAGPALAHECTNVARNDIDPSKGAQIIFGCGEDEILAAKPHALALLQSGKFPSGWIAFDVDCDGVADAGTYIVGPEGEIPTQAQQNGSPDHGVVNICDYFGLPPNCFD